jgi:ATP-binding cassette, subfamily B, bacterial
MTPREGGVSWPRAVSSALALCLSAAPVVLFGVIALSLTVAVLPVATAWLVKHLLDDLTGTVPSWQEVSALAGGLVVAGVLSAVEPHASRYAQAELGRRSSLAAQDRLYRAVNRISGLAPFESPAFLDRLRMAEQAGLATPGQLTMAALTLLRNCVTCIGFVASLMVISAPLTAVVLVAAGPAFLGELRLARARVGALVTTTGMQRREWFYASLLGDPQAAKEVRLFGIGDHLRTRMLGERAAINVLQRRLDSRTVAVQGGLGLLSATVAGLALGWAIWLTTSGDMTIGELSMVLAALAAVRGSLDSLAFGVAACVQHVTIFRHYQGVVGAGGDRPGASAGTVTGHAVPGLRRGIELRDVWFRYSEDHPWALRGVTLTIPYGASVGIVGANGAGKSTLVKLLCRFYDPTRGSILWDGVDLRDLPVVDLRQRISAIFQDFMRYDMTAAENIALGDLTADKATIEWAAGLAGVHGVLTELPQGYDSLLGRSFGTDDGVNLSGGQWQRVAVARALVRERRDLIILDEPTSGLDAAAEHEIHAGLRRHRGDRTSLLVSHRLGTIRTADIVVVLDDGQIVERGDHDRLMAAAGAYARLFRMQAEGYLPTATVDAR